MTSINDVITELERFAPPMLQEEYDNSGLLVGNVNDKLKGILVSIDTTEDIVQEAIDNNLNLIISHHPIIFKGLKSLTGKNYIERTLLKAIKNDIAIYAIHTNLDAVFKGVNYQIAKKLKLKDLKILDTKNNTLLKLIVFVPNTHLNEVKEALFNAGAGNVGNYSNCSFYAEGKGSFKANENANPYVGEIGETHIEAESKLELILPSYLKSTVLSALFKIHPYEEVAFDLIPVLNNDPNTGSGMIGFLEEEMDENSFLNFLKKTMKTDCIRHTRLLGKKVAKIAFCGGSGDFLLEAAIRQNADVFISGDFKYHRFFDADNKIVIMDIGHYESEQFTIDLLVGFLTEIFSTFAVRFTEVKTNPINYF